MLKVLTLVGVVALTACSFGSDGDDSAVERADLENIVLQESDLPRPFLRFDEGPQTIGETRGGSRADPNRFGRAAGWKARFRRPGTATTAGPLLVESLVDLFESSDGAADDLDALRDDVAEARAGWKPVNVAALGDEAAGFTMVQPRLGGPVAFHLVAWRQGNVAASISISGFARSTPIEDAVELAHKQARRIQRAAR